MDAHISRRATRLSETLLWGGVIVATLSLLGMGLQTVYSLLSAFPEVGSIALPVGWLVGIGVGIALGLAGVGISSRKPRPTEEAVEHHPRGAARAA